MKKESTRTGGGDLANHLDRRKQTRTKVRWPITIYTNKGSILGESRNITSAGIFIHCHERLREDEVYRMAIRFPQRQPIEVKGKLMWSNLKGVDSESPFAGMGFSFVKISDEDRHLLDAVVSAYPQ